MQKFGFRFRSIGLLSLAAAALALLPQAPALAFDSIPGDRTTSYTLPLDQELVNYSYIDSATDKDWWKVNLTAGKAYILRSSSYSCGVTVNVYNRSGVKLKTAGCYGVYQAGLEFIPSYTGVHYVEFASNGRSTSYPFGYYPDALNDCAGSKVSGCTQPLDLDWSTRLQTRGDSDWRSINLRAGQTYTAMATDGDRFFLSVRRVDGTILAFQSGYSPRIVFRAPTTGKYFVEAKAISDTYFGSTLVHYMVATGNLPALAPAKAKATEQAPLTPAAALAAGKAAAGKEIID